MKKKILIKFGGVIFCVLTLITLVYYACHLYVKKEINLKTTYIAKHDIPPRSKISESDVLTVQLAEAYIVAESYQDIEEIVGKYTDIQGMIPAGSMFYKSMLYDAKDIPDDAFSQLRNGQAAFVLQTDMSQLGSIQPGNRVDLYVTIEQKDKAPITGCLLEGIRVISIKDHKGLDIDHPDSTKTPYITELAINREDIELVSLAQEVGKLRLFSSTNPYDVNQEAQRVTDSDCTKYLENILYPPQTPLPTPTPQPKKEEKKK